jgi:hypothetical protein
LTTSTSQRIDSHGRVNYHGRVNSSSSLGSEAARTVASLLEGAGWTVTAHESADFLIRKGRLRYVVEVKRVREGRSDRLVPVVAQAILQAQHYSRLLGNAKPLVVVVGDAIPPRVAEAVKEFLQTYAPDTALGLLEAGGRCEFIGPGLDVLTRIPSQVERPQKGAKAVALFSDLNQWMLKVLLAADLDNRSLLNASPARYRNATELAQASRVSIMTAFRFIEQLRAAGYLHESNAVIRLVRLDDLMERWRMASAAPVATVRAKWLFPADWRGQLRNASQHARDLCLRSYAAADALGCGVVRGVPTELYVREEPHVAAKALGLLPSDGPEADVFLAIPRARESVFRGAVEAGGIRTSDVLQVWLDVSHDPGRGREQADHLYRKVIQPMLNRAREW